MSRQLIFSLRDYRVCGGDRPARQTITETTQTTISISCSDYHHLHSFIPLLNVLLFSTQQDLGLVGAP